VEVRSEETVGSGTSRFNPGNGQVLDPEQYAYVPVDMGSLQKLPA
jgi:hypothetical protein